MKEAMWEYLGMVARPSAGHSWFEAHRCCACGHLELRVMADSAPPRTCPICAHLARLEASIEALRKRRHDG